MCIQPTNYRTVLYRIRIISSHLASHPPVLDWFRREVDDDHVNVNGNMCDLSALATPKLGDKRPRIQNVHSSIE